MLVYTHSLTAQKVNSELDEIFHSINTLQITRQPLQLSNPSCLSFTVDWTRFPLGPVLNKMLFKTSSAAGYKRTGGSGASPLRGAPFRASHSLVSLESHGSAAKKGKSLLHTCLCGIVSIPVCPAGMNLTCTVRMCFLIKGVCVYLFKSSRQKNTNLLHSVGGCKGPAERSN